MNISFACGGCGKSYVAPPELAGKALRCKQCGEAVRIPSQTSNVNSPTSPTRPAGTTPEWPTIPTPRAKPSTPAPSPSRPAPWKEPDPGIYDLDEPAPIALTADDTLDDSRGSRGFPPRPSPAGSPSGNTDKPKNPKRAPVGRSSDFTTKAIAGGSVGVVGALAICFRLLRVANSVGHAVTGPHPAHSQPAIPAVSQADLPAATPLVFPELGPAILLTPGVVRHEVSLGPPHAGPGTSPGHRGRLWIYVPPGSHEPRSLPCVLITGAGSTLLAGMDLADGDVAEHFPYVRAGFAVMAYELDGAAPDGATEQQLLQSMKSYLAARAGLVNAKNALEYLLAKVPQVDPERLYSAGHSSAGTMSLLFAENEPRLKGCIAFAPAVDVNMRLRSQNSAMIDSLVRAGFGDLFSRYNPRKHEQNLRCPVFLFHAQDDSNVPISESSGLADRLRQAGTDVTLETVPTGGHYDSMIQQGIPKAIAWLKSR